MLYFNSIRLQLSDSQFEKVKFRCICIISEGGRRSLPIPSRCLRIPCGERVMLTGTICFEATEASLVFRWLNRETQAGGWLFTLIAAYGYLHMLGHEPIHMYSIIL
jgi:hypothetical protein